jgi:hypothetical protein
MACGMANVQSNFFMTAKPQLATKPLSQYRAELSNFFFCWKSHILGKIFRQIRTSMTQERQDTGQGVTFLKGHHPETASYQK